MAWTLFATVIAAAAQPPTSPLPAEIAAIAGRWSVDLRPNLTDGPYSKPMILTIAADRTLAGSFYDSDILAGRAGRGQGRACVGFRTIDGQGLYHSSACLVDGKMVGQTWSEQRGFTLPWTAERSG